MLEVTESDVEVVFEELPVDDPTRRCPDIGLARPGARMEADGDAARRPGANTRLVSARGRERSRRRRGGQRSSSTTRPVRCSPGASGRSSTTPARVRSRSSSSTTALATDRSPGCAPSFPDVPVVTAGRNLGYSGGANLGVAATHAPVVAVCNPDLRVRAGTAAAVLARFDAEADLAAVGPVVRETDGTRVPVRSSGADGRRRGRSRARRAA